MSLAQAGKVLMTRSVFDSARQVLKGEDIEGVGPLEWLNHGPYLLKGLEEAVEICEAREAGQETGGPPTSSEKAQRQIVPGDEQVLGWRPAVGQLVPKTKWILQAKLGEGGFGEVWLGLHQTMKEQRVFEFCFQAERVRFLKRELTLFRLLKEQIGDHPNIVRLHEVFLDEPPCYVEMDYVEGKDLRTWCEDHGGIGSIPLETRLEIVARIAEALKAAHESGIIHRDVKPTNILVGGKGVKAGDVRVKLTDFGIGQVVSQEYLSGITRAGFTETLFSCSSSSQTGTHLYMAPELMAGRPASTSADIYSLGVVLYQLLVEDFSEPVTTDWMEKISDPVYDMAGNAGEWCWNATTSGNRSLLGGTWDDNDYWFSDLAESDPFDRSPSRGFRCMKARSEVGISKTALDSVTRQHRDYKKEKPVADEIFQVYKNLFEYDRGSPLDSIGESVDDGSALWKKEKITFKAAYGDERVPAYLFLGVSLGAAIAPRILAVEDRVKTGVLIHGGLFMAIPLPHVDVFNFVPRVTIPVLMVNGRHDSTFPLETSQVPLFQLLGTPPEHKQHIIYPEQGHTGPPRSELVNQIKSWLDKYFGPVK